MKIPIPPRPSNTPAGANSANCRSKTKQSPNKTIQHDVLSIGVDRIQRNFEPMKKHGEAWKGTRLPDESAKLVICRAFVEGELDDPKHLARRVHDLYFNPQVEEFAPRTTWSLSDAFTKFLARSAPHVRRVGELEYMKGAAGSESLSCFHQSCCAIDRYLPMLQLLT